MRANLITNGKRTKMDTVESVKKKIKSMERWVMRRRLYAKDIAKSY